MCPPAGGAAPRAASCLRSSRCPGPEVREGAQVCQAHRHGHFLQGHRAPFGEGSLQGPAAGCAEEKGLGELRGSVGGSGMADVTCFEGESDSVCRWVPAQRGEKGWPGERCFSVWASVLHGTYFPSSCVLLT